MLLRNGVSYQLTSQEIYDQMRAMMPRERQLKTPPSPLYWTDSSVWYDGQLHESCNAVAIRAVNTARFQRLLKE